MTYASILNTLGSYERQFGAATFSVRGHGARCKKHDAITFDNLFSGDSAVDRRRGLRRRADHVPAGQRLREGGRRGRSISTITSTEEPKTATLERVWLDDPRPRAGRTVPLKVLLRTYRGEEVAPHAADRRFRPTRSGTLSLLVSDGARLAQIEQREARTPQQPRSVPQMIRALNKAPPQQHAVRAAARLRRRRRRQRRTAVVAAAVGAGACSRPIATAATSTRSTAPRSASGSCRPSRPSAARGRSPSRCRPN